jgi:hypothetical protein
VATRARFSPDGRYLIAWGRQTRGSEDDERAKAWDTHAHKEVVGSTEQIATYRYSGVEPGTLAFLERLASEDGWFDIFDNGRLAIVGVRGSTVLWDLRNRQPLPTLKSLTGGERPTTMADGRYVAADGSNVIDLRTGAVVFAAPGRVLGVTRSGRVATGEFGLVQIWRMSPRELEARLRVDGTPTAVAFSPDEHDIAIAADVDIDMRKWQLDDAVVEVCELLRDNSIVQPWRSLIDGTSYQTVCGMHLRSSRRASTN